MTRSPVLICLQIWQRCLLQQVLPLVALSEVGNWDGAISLLRLGGWRSARRGGSVNRSERVGSSLRDAKDCFKVRARLGIRG